jgi:hypothetical protein
MHLSPYGHKTQVPDLSIFFGRLNHDLRIRKSGQGVCLHEQEGLLLQWRKVLPDC